MNKLKTLIPIKDNNKYITKVKQDEINKIDYLINYDEVKKYEECILVTKNIRDDFKSLIYVEGFKKCIGDNLEILKMRVINNCLDEMVEKRLKKEIINNYKKEIKNRKMMYNKTNLFDINMIYQNKIKIF